jgi:1-acyl-sn-glycerol-3-phosphate acyltransferase
MRPLFSIAFWLYLAVTATILFGIALVLWVPSIVFDRRRVVLHRLTSLWARHYIALWPWWRIVIVGRHRLPAGAAVIAANHQSMADILALFGLYSDFKWVSKAEVFSAPIIGWIMLMNRYIPLRRGDPASIAVMMKRCREHLQEGSSVLIFPEGTRSRDGTLKPFKHGAFTLAIEARVPLVPVVVHDTLAALPPSGWVLRERVDARVEVLDPIPWDATGGDVQALSDLARDRIDARLRELQGERSERGAAQAVRLGHR